VAIMAVGRLIGAIHLSTYPHYGNWPVNRGYPLDAPARVLTNDLAHDAVGLRDDVVYVDAESRL
jgi:hypothetical protein